MLGIDLIHDRHGSRDAINELVSGTALKEDCVVHVRDVLKREDVGVAMRGWIPSTPKTLVALKWTSKPSWRSISLALRAIRDATMPNVTSASGTPAATPFVGTVILLDTS